MATTQCGLPGEWRVMWPGREPLYMCAVHANQALGVAEAMGFFLHTEVALVPGENLCSNILQSPAKSAP
jgi:hypothetical protein